MKSGDNQEFGISTDTRKITPSDIYLPLKGANFDGEQFIDNPDINAYFTTQDKVTENAKLVLKVENTLDAYLKLAEYYIQKNICLILLELPEVRKNNNKRNNLFCPKPKFKTHKTYSNHNNEIGFVRLF